MVLQIRALNRPEALPVPSIFPDDNLCVLWRCPAPRIPCQQFWTEIRAVAVDFRIGIPKKFTGIS